MVVALGPGASLGSDRGEVSGLTLLGSLPPILGLMF